jgi:type I restriction enzyme S subunit
MVPEGWFSEKPERSLRIIGGAAFSSQDATESGARWLKIANVGIGRITWQDSSFLPDAFRLSHKAFILEEGDIVVALTRPTLGGKLKIARIGPKDFGALLNQRVGKLQTTERLDHDFLFHLFRTDEIAHRINTSLLGTDPPNLSIKVLGDFHILIPPLPEQRKIADILSTWDQAIEKTEALLSNARTQKRALMQQLITGKRRFPAFEGQPWKEVRLGDVVTLIAGKSKRELLVDDGSMIVLDMGSVSRTGLIIPKKRTNTDQDILSIGDLVMPKDDIGGGNIIGKVVLVAARDRYVLGDHVYRLRVKDADAINPAFLRYVINATEVNHWFRRKANGTAQLGLNRKDIEKQPISLPSFAEQAEIAEIMNDAEELEADHGQHIEKLRTEKKALMQQLLTGKRRVAV